MIDRFWIAWSAVILACVAGCAEWSHPPTGDLTKLSMPNLAPGSVVLEVTFVRIPPDDVGFADHLWPEIDEQALPNDLRRRLAANGFRVGTLDSPLPTVLQQLVDEQAGSEPISGNVTVRPGNAAVARTHQIRSHAGQPGKVVVRSTPLDKVAALTRDPEGHIRGESLDAAQFHFSIATTPRGDGHVQLELTPVIEYGKARSRYVGQDGTWALNSNSRPTKTYGDLKAIATLAPGQMMALGCTQPPRGLGAQFFAADSGEGVPRLLLLVRLQQTQLDDRYEDLADSGPVASEIGR